MNVCVHGLAVETASPLRGELSLEDNMNTITTTWCRVASVGISSLLLLFCSHVLAASGPGSTHVEKLPEVSTNASNREIALQRRSDLHKWLLSESIGQALGNPVSAMVTSAEAAAVDKAANERPVRVGLTKQLSEIVSFRDLSASQIKGRTLARNVGAITQTSDGGFVFTAALSSPGATALRVHFSGFRLPPNTGLYLYTDAGEVFGPYKDRGPLGTGEFWSHTLVGDLVMLQLRHIGPADDTALRGTGFTISGLGHIRPNFLAGTCSENATCVENVECTSSSSVDDARMAVAHMQWISGPYIYICSGGLVADTDTSTELPYFLSANHCISRGKDASSLENFFQLTKPCNSGSSCPSIFDIRDNHPQNMRTLGASILSTGKDADYTLFQLNQSPPGDSTYLGWTNTPVAFDDSADLYRVSHPGGSPQSYSEHEVDTGAQTCRGWPRGNRIYSRDMVGATEGGSSGSPVVNFSGQIVGQLSGACGYNLGDVCDSSSNATVDGAFAAYFDRVSDWLDPTPGIGCEPEPEICDDLVDNDCDGDVDLDDSDCITGGVGLPGDSCTDNSDCLSKSCKGRPNYKTCK